MSLAGWLSGLLITEAEVRTEIWHLGARHLGAPLEGALRELEASELPARRAILLSVCVRKLRRQ